MRIIPIGSLIPTLAAGILSAALVPSVRAQGSGSSRVAPPIIRQPAPTYRPAAPTYRQPYTIPAQPRPSVPRPPTTAEFARSLWVFLVRHQSPYTQWPALPGKEGLREVAGPHGPSVRLYANATALADPKGLPPGSILILEDYAADQKSRTGINILYRVKGFDPKNGDWYWMKYLENGTLVRTAPSEGGSPLAGRLTSCVDCHRKAAAGDFVFSNDPTDKAVGKPEGKEAGEKKSGESPPEKAGEKIEEKKGAEGRVRSTGPQILLGSDWPAAEQVSIDTIDQRPWNVLLTQHVDAKGRVDYAAWKASPDHVRYDASRNQVRLSAILDWHGDDFGKDAAESLRTIAP